MISRKHHGISFLLAGVLATSGVTGAGLIAGQQPAAAAEYETVTSGQALRIVDKYTGEWTAPPLVHFTPPPLNPGNDTTTDAPLLGNGDVAVALGGEAGTLTAFVGKSDFWAVGALTARPQAVLAPVGRVIADVAGFQGASYRLTQDIATAEVRGSFTIGGQTLSTASRVAATDNVMITTLLLTGGAPQAASIEVKNGVGATPAGAPAMAGDVMTADLPAKGADLVPDVMDPVVRIGTRVLAANTTFAGGKLDFTMVPGTTYTVVSSVISNNDAGAPTSMDFQTTAVSKVVALDETEVENLTSAHRSWWNDFWGKSFVEIPNKAIEKAWYGSQYIMGSTSRSGEAAPGLYGHWATGKMAWGGDYHLNYNYEIPFLGPIGSNHIEQAESYDQPILDYIDKGTAIATAEGLPGVKYPVGIGPHGQDVYTTTHGQSTNAAYTAIPMIARFYATYDTTYAAGVYSYLKQAAAFWEEHLVAEPDGTYSINDAVYEGGPILPNPTASLSYVGYLFEGLVDISEALDRDTAARATWVDIRDNLSEFPIGTYDSKPVLDEYEGANRVDQGGNDIVAQAIYPSGQLGLDSSSAFLEASHNLLDAYSGAWHGANAPATIYAAAARVGYKPALMMSRLAEEATFYSFNNMAIHHYGGGIENTNVVVSSIGEMMLQSHQGNLKLFPSWPENTNGKFGDLRAKGAFLVSSSLRDNEVEYVRIVSEKGRPVVVTNPWPGESVQVYRGDDSEVIPSVEGEETFTLDTDADEVLYLALAGTPLGDIEQKLAEEIAESSATGNLAAGKVATQSSTASSSPASRAVDGTIDPAWANGSVSVTRNDDPQTWWQVDLGSSWPISSINVHNRTDGTQETYLSNYWVFVSNTPFDTTLSAAQQAAQPGVWSNHQTAQAGNPTSILAPTTGRYVMIQQNTPGWLNLAEVEVLAVGL